MHIDWWTLGLQTVNVLILVGLLSRFLYRPVVDVIAARQEAAQTLLAEAQTTRDAALAEATALKARDDAFIAEADRRRKEMEGEIAQERDRLLAQARTGAEVAAKQATAQAEAGRARAADEWQEKAATLAGHMAAMLLARLPPALTTQAMFDALVGQLEGLSENNRHDLAQDARLVMLTASPVAAADQQRYGARLSTIFANPVAIDFAIDPGLIAGFELHGKHMRIRNSWRADLDGMLATLKEDGHARIA